MVSTEITISPFHEVQKRSLTFFFGEEYFIGSLKVMKSLKSSSLISSIQNVLHAFKTMNKVSLKL